MNKPRYYIGLDCGVNTGLAIWDSQEKKFERIATVKIHEAMKTVEYWHPRGILVRVEDARKRKWFADADARQKRSGAGIREGIGSVKRDAKVWEDFLQAYKIPFELVPPKNNKTKITTEFFTKATGWKQETNEHARDAAMLVFGF